MKINEKALNIIEEKRKKALLESAEREAKVEYFFECLRYEVCPKCGADLDYVRKTHFFSGVEYTYTCKLCGIIYNNKSKYSYDDIMA